MPKGKVISRQSSDQPGRENWDVTVVVTDARGDANFNVGDEVKCTSSKPVNTGQQVNFAQSGSEMIIT